MRGEEEGRREAGGKKNLVLDKFTDVSASMLTVCSLSSIFLAGTRGRRPPWSDDSFNEVTLVYCCSRVIKGQCGPG